MGLVYNVIWYLSQLRNQHAGPPSALTNEDLSFLKEIIEASPSLYPDECNKNSQMSERSRLLLLQFCEHSSTTSICHKKCHKSGTGHDQLGDGWWANSGGFKKCKELGSGKQTSSQPPLFGSGTYHMTVFRNVSIFTKICEVL